MSRFGPMRCYECGNPLDDKYEAFCYMRLIIDEMTKSRSHIEKRMLDTKESKSLGAIYDALQLRRRKECCLKAMLTTVLPRDLETRTMSFGL